MNEGDDEGDPGRVRRLVASVAVIAALLLAGLWLTGVLHGTASIQDCVAAGRSNC